MEVGGTIPNNQRISYSSAGLPSSVASSLAASVMGQVTVGLGERVKSGAIRLMSAFFPVNQVIVKRCHAHRLELVASDNGDQRRDRKRAGRSWVLIPFASGSLPAEAFRTRHRRCDRPAAIWPCLTGSAPTARAC